ncbi:hypothetical protein L7F22_047168 [Adiantum nelumboides]|nr:hypothetical protein [Adiantum nelumboides]
MDPTEVAVVHLRERAGILKGTRQEKPTMNNPTGHASSSSSSSSSISSLHSISTQASVYTPTFNPTSSDSYYDVSIDSSDSSTWARNAGLRSKAATAATIGHRRLNLVRPSNLTPLHTEVTLPPNPHRIPSNDDIGSIQGYLSDVSSTSSFVRPALKPHSDSHSHSSINSDNAKLHKSSNVITSLSFKERNFNFDFENESLTSTLGVQAFEDVYGDPTRPPPPPLHASLSSQTRTPTPTSTTSIPQSNSTSNEGFVSSQRVPPNKPSANGGIGPKTLETIQDINTPTSTNATSLRQSSVSSSSLSSKVPRDFSLTKRLEPSAQALSEQTNEISSETTSTECSEGQGSSLKMGASRGTFLSCIPKGICMLDGNVKSAAPRMTINDDMARPSNPIKSLWADAYQPTSFDECLCHVQQAELLSQLISQGNCPHLFFHGTSTYGKKLLIKVLLREIYGPSAWQVCKEKREFTKKALYNYGMLHCSKGEKKLVKQLLASKVHVELDAQGLAENARAILVGLCKDIAHSMESSRVIVKEENIESNFRGVKTGHLSALPTLKHVVMGFFTYTRILLWHPSNKALIEVLEMKTNAFCDEGKGGEAVSKASRFCNHILEAGFGMTSRCRHIMKILLGILAYIDNSLGHFGISSPIL